MALRYSPLSLMTSLYQYLSPELALEFYVHLHRLSLIAGVLGYPPGLRKFAYCIIGHRRPRVHNFNCNWNLGWDKRTLFQFD